MHPQIASQAAANKMAGLSGREMFTLNPDFYAGDEDEEDDEVSHCSPASLLSLRPRL